MRRLHFIELHEQSWVPRFLRESFVESLSIVLRITGVYRGVPPLYAEWLRNSGGREVLDLASGAAGPTETLITDLQRIGIEPPRFCLSDLFPVEDKFIEMKLAHPRHISFITKPVDALCVDRAYGHDLRQIISAFHHFKPDQARLIVEDAVKHGKGICILEPFQRNAFHMLIAALTIFPALIAPFFARKWRLRHFLTTIVIPVVPLMLVFDAAISVLRSYTKEEIKQMVDSFSADSFHWVIGSTRFMLLFQTTYVFGWKKSGGNL
jgi:hypothetical protein